MARPRYDYTPTSHSEDELNRLREEAILWRKNCKSTKMIEEKTRQYGEFYYLTDTDEEDTLGDEQETNSLHKHSNMQAVELSVEPLNKLIAAIEKRQNDN